MGKFNNKGLIMHAARQSRWTTELSVKGRRRINKDGEYHACCNNV